MFGSALLISLALWATGAEQVPTETDAAWASRCTAALDDAHTAMGRRYRRMRYARASALPPINRPTWHGEGRAKPTPPVVRTRWSVATNIQPPSVAEHFYVDVGDVVDGREDRAPHAESAWRCEHTEGAERRRDVVCTQRVGSRYAVARAITWGRRAIIDDFTREFGTAIARCLSTP